MATPPWTSTAQRRRATFVRLLIGVTGDVDAVVAAAGRTEAVAAGAADAGCWADVAGVATAVAVAATPAMETAAAM
jgi:hypothetical protein